jgi:hypothetical protein
LRRNLIIADGIVAKRFLEQIKTDKSRDNEFFIVYQDDGILPKIKPENFYYYKFDATSFSKLSTMVKEEVTDVFIVLKNKSDALTIYENIRRITSKLKITLLDIWGVEIEDKALIKIDSIHILAQKVVERLPGVPVTPKDIGLGIGEIVEISIPFSSSYVYRFIGSIEQRNWKIVGIYRDGNLIVAQNHHVIQPNDSLLVIGDPHILKTVYNRVKEELGQFPNPFGPNIYLYIDFSVLDKKSVEKNINEALYLNQILKNKKLYIRVVNPNDFELLKKIRALHSRKISIEIEYSKDSFSNIIQNDIKQFNIGAIIIDSKLFAFKEHKRALFRFSLPVLKLGKQPLLELERTVVVLNDVKNSERISSVVFDVAKQLAHSIELYSFELEDSEKESLSEHYENLSKIFTKKIKYVDLDNKNPIRTLAKESALLQILPFSKDITETKISAIITPRVEPNYFMLDSLNQLFVPIRTSSQKVL